MESGVGSWSRSRSRIFRIAGVGVSFTDVLESELKSEYFKQVESELESENFEQAESDLESEKFIRFHNPGCNPAQCNSLVPKLWGDHFQ